MGTGGPAQATVLVVEDEPAVSDLFRNALAGEYDVRSASTGGAALARLDDDIDVVVLDRRMPDVSGDRVVERIEGQDLECRVAIVTAVDPDFDVIGMGFDDYLVKPVRPDELRETVDRLLTLSEYESVYRELSSKRVKQNILEVEKSPSELAHNEEYRELTERIDELEARLEGMAGDLDERVLPS